MNNYCNLRLIRQKQKCRCMSVGEDNIRMNIKVNGKKLQDVNKSSYSGSIIRMDGQSRMEIRNKINRAKMGVQQT